jgi:hypothetical protein
MCGYYTGSIQYYILLLQYLLRVKDDESLQYFISLTRGKLRIHHGSVTHWAGIHTGKALQDHQRSVYQVLFDSGILTLAQ